MDLSKPINVLIRIVNSIEIKMYKTILKHTFKLPIYILWVSLYITVMLWGLGAVCMERFFLGTPEQQAKESYEDSLF